LRSDYKQAATCFQHAYKIRARILGTESINTAAMQFNFGQANHHSGNLDQAMEAYTDFLRVARIHFRSKHRDVCAVQRAMAQIHCQRGELDKSIALLHKAFDQGCGALGSHANEVSCILTDLGNLYAEIKDYEKALDCFVRFLKIQEQVKSDNPLHSNILITKINIARVYKHCNNYSCALKYYKDVHQMQIKLYGPSHIEIAFTLSSMGLMHYQMQSFRKSLNCYQDALRIRLDKYGTSEHTTVLETVNSIGLVLFKLGLNSLAKQSFQECIRLRTILTGTHTREMAVLWFNLATVYLQSGEDHVAINLYREALRVERAVLGEDHAEIAMTLQHLANIHDERGHSDEAIAYYKGALNIVKRYSHDGDKSETVFRLLNLMGNLHFMQGRIKEMMECFVEACRIGVGFGMDTLSISGEDFYTLHRQHSPCPPAA
jgi:tetratricopeptide (TPR) repeat protein